MPDEVKESQPRGRPDSTTEQVGDSSLSRRIYTRREFLKFGGAFGAGVISGLGVPFVYDSLTGKERKRRAELLTKVEEAKTRVEQEKTFTQLTETFIEDFDYRVAVGNGSLMSVRQESMWIMDKWRASEREQARFLLERGAALVSLWGSLKGEEKAHFDERGRLHIGERRFLVNESEEDFHLALNLIRSGLVLRVVSEEDKLLRQEDYEDLLSLIDLDPDIEISPDAWIVMPPDWALHLARFFKITDKIDVPVLPTGVEISRNLQTSANIGGYFEGHRARFPEGKQHLVVGSGMPPSALFHEGAHYLAESFAIEERSIGVSREQEFPVYIKDYHELASRLEMDMFKEAREQGKIEIFDTFVTLYASTHPEEDFAETFTEYFARGPLFRRKIEKLRKNDPRAAEILEAKYQFMKEKVARGEEFSFGGRKARPDILDWEESVINSFGKESSMRDVAEWRAGSLEDRLRGKAGFEEAEIVPVIPEGDYGHGMSLILPRVWQDVLFPAEIEAISALHTFPHLEIRGKFTIRVPTEMGEEEITIDTNSSTSIEKFLKRIPKMRVNQSNWSAEIEYSNKTRELLREFGISPPEFSPWGWSRGSRADMVDQPNLAFVRFTYSNDTGRWETAPIDVRSIQILTSFSSPGGEKRRTLDTYHPLKIGEKDVIVAINDEGRVHEIKLVRVPELSAGQAQG